MCKPHSLGRAWPFLSACPATRSACHTGCPGPPDPTPASTMYPISKCSWIGSMDEPVHGLSLSALSGSLSDSAPTLVPNFRLHQRALAPFQPQLPHSPSPQAPGSSATPSSSEMPITFNLRATPLFPVNLIPRILSQFSTSVHSGLRSHSPGLLTGFPESLLASPRPCLVCFLGLVPNQVPSTPVAGFSPVHRTQSIASNTW